MARADKATAVADITEQFNAATATLITEYRGLTVANLAELRRSLAIPTFVDFDERKLLAHLKTADRNGARYALILGDDELAAKSMVLRDLAERSDRSIPLGSGKDVAASLVEMGV